RPFRASAARPEGRPGHRPAAGGSRPAAGWRRRAEDRRARPEAARPAAWSESGWDCRPCDAGVSPGASYHQGIRRVYVRLDTASRCLPEALLRQDELVGSGDAQPVAAGTVLDDQLTPPAHQRRTIDDRNCLGGALVLSQLFDARRRGWWHDNLWRVATASQLHIV